MSHLFVSFRLGQIYFYFHVYIDVCRYNTPADMWGAGCIFAEMISGTHFGGAPVCLCMCVCMGNYIDNSISCIDLALTGCVFAEMISCVLVHRFLGAISPVPCVF